MKLLENWYLGQTKQKQLVFDDAQLRILQQLDGFIDKFNQQNFFTRWFSKPSTLGYYIYGSVGRGKSMIMNELYRVLPDKHKTRLHFHEFMDNIQHQLAALKSHEEPLKVVAKNMKEKYKIIFLDEMLVNDIANAMILKNLFSSLFAEGIFVITSSNSKPDNLYFEGLMRDRFLPAIALLNQKLVVLCLDSPNDYRSLHDSSNQLFMIKDSSSSNKLNAIFDDISATSRQEENNTILIQARQLPFTKKSAYIIWLDFAIICGDKRSQLDYLELVKHFNWFIIENISALTDKDKDMVRRFTWLIDVLYDHQCKLALSCKIELSAIYPDGDLMHDFARTLSRLREMQTQEYLDKPILKF